MNKFYRKDLGSHDGDTDANINLPIHQPTIYLGIQINHESLNADDATITVETSVDGVEWSELINPDGTTVFITIDSNESPSSIRINAPLEGYIRLVYVANSVTAGTFTPKININAQ